MFPCQSLGQGEWWRFRLLWTSPVEKPGVGSIHPGSNHSLILPPDYCIFLEECGYLARKSPTVEEDLPTWDDIFPLICHSNKLLQALLTPATKKELYYRNILYEALRAGFQDPKMLKGLLWHAPHGGVRQDPERRQKLSQWVAEVLPLLAAEALGTASESPGWESDLASPLAPLPRRGQQTKLDPTGRSLRGAPEHGPTPSPGKPLG